MIVSLVVSVLAFAWSFSWYLRFTGMMRSPRKLTAAELTRATWLALELAGLAVVLQSMALFALAVFVTLGVGLYALDVADDERKRAADQPPDEGGW